MTKPRIIVFAYHDVGYECLNLLLQRGDRVVAVYTHQDNPKETIWFKSVATLAAQYAIPVFTPENPNDPAVIAEIKILQPDLIFSFYYRHMLPQEILQLPRLGAFNMHGSLLPKYRGRVPINWAIIYGEQQCGATLHHMVKRADAGDIVDQEPVTIDPEETAQQVFLKVIQAAKQVLQRQIDNMLQGIAPRRSQDETQATYFSGRRPEDGRVQWQQSAEQIFNLIRAVTHPYPGAFTEIDGKRLLIWWAKPIASGGNTPGEILSHDPFIIATGNNALQLLEWEWAS